MRQEQPAGSKQNVSVLLCMQVHLSLVYANPATQCWTGQALSSQDSSSLSTQPTVSSAMPPMGLHSHHDEPQCAFAPISVTTEQAMTMYF